MEEFLEFNVFREERGTLAACRIFFRPQKIIFKNIKTGKTSTISSDEVLSIDWQRMATDHGLRIILTNGTLHRFDGFNEAQKDTIKLFVETHYKKQLKTLELSLKGFNWGSTEFDGEALRFNLENQLPAFEIPLNAVQDCTTSKNEVILNFHHNDDAAVGMTDMRLYMPTSGGEDETIKAFVDKVLSRASVIKVVGQSVATFHELQCLTPRGRYDLKLFPTFIQLHGKTFDYKIPITTVLRLFKLPHKDGRQVFFVLSLDPPIVQGQTRYQFLQMLFYKEDELDIVIDMDEAELNEKFDGILQKNMSGPSIDVFSSVVKAVVKKRINLPDYVNGTNSAISCSYKNNNGLLYPLERGFMYVHKPAIHVRFEEISSINFARSDGSTRSFDLEIETKAGSTHIFNSIEKEEYARLFDFVSKKKLRIKNRNLTAKVPTTAEIVDDMIDSDDEASDAYLTRVKKEGRTREQEDVDSEEEDEDFDPDAAANSDESSGSDSGDGSDDFESDNASDDSDDSGAKRKKSKSKAPSPKKAKSAVKSKAGESSKKSAKSAPRREETSRDSSSQKFKSREYVDDDDDSDSD